MKNPFIAAGSLIAAIALVASAGAATLENQDDQAYKVDVITEQETRTVSIEAGATIDNICGSCVLYVVGTEQDVTAGENTKLVIRDGEIVSEDQ